MFRRGTEEIRPGLWRLYEPLGERLLACYAMSSPQGWILFDAALPGSVTNRIAEGSWGGTFAEVIISHADADHLGDVAQLKRRFPALRVKCHSIDKPLIENHDRLTAQRYDYARERYGFGYPQATLDGLRAACGDDFKVDDVLHEGDRVDGAGQSWEVLHTPGHSAGHICLWNADRGELLLSDAVLGVGAPDVSGRSSMPPTHQNIEAYLATLDRLAQLPIKFALPAHWEPLAGEAFLAHIQLSREAVYRDLATVEELVFKNTSSSFSQLLEGLNSRWSVWPDSENDHYFYALCGYLDHLADRGVLQVTESGTVIPA